MTVPDVALTGTAQRVLETLLELDNGASGRRVAEAVGVSPTTATAALAKLRDAGVVDSRRSGRAVLWTIRMDAPRVVELLKARRVGPVVASTIPRIAADADQWVTEPGADIDRPRLRAVVFTALPTEYSAVLSHLSEHRREKTPTGTRYQVGLFRGKRVDWDVYVAEIGMGNMGSAVEVSGAVTVFNPQLILFVGVAGGLKPDDQIHGDVVIADRVYNVHSAKLAAGLDGASDVLARPVSLPTSHRLVQLVREVARTAWQPESAAKGSQRAPLAHIKPIAAVEVVLADEASEFRKRIAREFNDAAAVDMESYGVYEAAHRMETPVLAIRGLSDLIGDKTAADDHERQPLAAVNAAAFAAALLRHGEDDDFPAGRASPLPVTPGRNALPESDRSDADAAVDRLAPTVRPWWRRLRLTSKSRADAAVLDLDSHSDSPTGWLGRVRHRPPGWLREDTSGEAWALVARFAASHSSPHATAAHDRAAQLAADAGHDVVAAWHRLSAALSCVRNPSPDEADGAASAAQAEAIRRLNIEETTLLASVATFLKAAIRSDVDATLHAAGTVLPTLNIHNSDLDLAVGGSQDKDGSAAAAVAELEETDPDIVGEIRAEVLLILSLVLLAEDNTNAALSAAVLAREAAPAWSGPLVVTVRALLQRVGGADAGRAHLDNTSAVLAEAEQLALLARDRANDWNGSTGEALALAGRARAQLGDIDGALQLLLPAPRGRASDREAAHPAVKETASVAAALMDNVPLAVELAEGVSDPVERNLLRAMALSRGQNTREDAKRAYWGALSDSPDEPPGQLVRALLGLARLGAPTEPGTAGSIAEPLQRLRSLDSEAADLVKATAAISAGEHRAALVLTRQYPRSAAAVELAAEAAAATGQMDEAVRALERAGRERGDNAMIVQAMQLAAGSGRSEDAERLATTLLAGTDQDARRQALRIRLTLAGREGRWEDAADISRRLLADERPELAGSDSAELVSYRWSLALAEFNLRRAGRALDALQSPTPLMPRHREEAMLLLSVMQPMSTEPPSVLEPAQAIERALDVAADWPDDEEIVASAVTLAIMLAQSVELPSQLVVRLRSLQDDYFAKFPESKLLRRLDVGDDLENLVQYLRETFEPRTDAFDDLVRRVWLGVYPLAVLADVTHRSYAEALIKRSVGCRVVAGNIADVDQRRAAARTAVTHGSVAVDTSALYMLEHTQLPERRLTAEFARVILPGRLRDDILRAAEGLAVRSVGTLGWDPAQQKPVLTEISPEQADEWAADAARLAGRLSMVEVAAQTTSRDGHTWDSALLLAKEMNIPLWVDDAALCHAAVGAGVAAFGTLDLVDVLTDSRTLDGSDRQRVIDGFVKAWAVDLPIAHQVLYYAREDGWQPGGYAAVLLSRPRTWMPPGDGFAEYTAVVRALPEGNDHAARAQWAEAAATGLSWSVPPPARPRVIAALLAWTILQVGDGAILPTLLDVGERVQRAAAPDGDVLPHLVSTLADAIEESDGPAVTGVVMSRLLGTLDAERRTAAMKVFLGRPRNQE